MPTLDEVCQEIYARGGQSAVYDYIIANLPEQRWAWCEACDCDSPIDTDLACLVCGSLTEGRES